MTTSERVRAWARLRQRRRPVAVRRGHRHDLPRPDPERHPWLGAEHGTWAIAGISIHPAPARRCVPCWRASCSRVTQTARSNGFGRKLCAGLVQAAAVVEQIVDGGRRLEQDAPRIRRVPD